MLPLRWSDDAGLDELTDYLGRLARWVDVTVVDGSGADVYARHAARWRGLVRHRPVRPWPGRNGKVAGVVTGVRAARHEHVVIADDDVRYDYDGLAEVQTLLGRADLVRPQNYFDPTPWHARWDTGRTLLNRAFGADYPGTYGVRRSTFVAMGGYDGDVLFENLELARTIRAAGGRELVASSLFVCRRPPAAHHFLRQRVRQAYDDFAQPARLLVEASVAPVLLLALGRAARTDRETRSQVMRSVAIAMAATVASAEAGRRRHGGTTVFPATAALWAPAWVLERSICVWAAFGYRLLGGVPYAGQRLRVAAHSVRELRRRIQSAAPAPDRASGRVHSTDLLVDQEDRTGRQAQDGSGQRADPDAPGLVGVL